LSVHRVGYGLWRPAALAAVAILAVSVAGCGRKTSSPPPSPSPTPTVVSVAPQLSAAMANRNFQFEGQVQGTQSYIANGVTTDLAVSGVFLYKAGDYSWKLTTQIGPGKAADETSTVQYMGVGKYKYTCDQWGHWTRSARPGGVRTHGLGGVFFVTRKLEDVGLDSMHGQVLHKLQWVDGPGVDSATIDFRGDDDVSGMLVRAYFWADDGGRPAGVSYWITVPAGAGTSEADIVWKFDVVFTKLSGIKITPPAV
jgi:hypothetical protein